MIATLFLYSCVLAPAQFPERPGSVAAMPRNEWQPETRLTRGQELYYRGTIDEFSSGSGVQFTRSYRLESRVFVLETAAKEASVALLTILKSREITPGRPAGASDAMPSSVRLELAKVTIRGKVIADPSITNVPVQGVPTIECGAFLELPARKLAIDQTWEVREDGKPGQSWKVTALEQVNGASCLKLVGEQQSDDWDAPRADRAAWHRQDIVWMGVRTGFAYRVERTIERRDPAHKVPTHRSLLRYDLDSSMSYNGDYEERASDIQQARAFAESAAPWVMNPTRYAPQLNTLLSRINAHLDQHPARTPYREAVVQVKKRVEAARRGETPPAPPSEDPTNVGRAAAAVGNIAPDFLATDLATGSTTRLKSLLGKPTLLIFYSPTAPISSEVLRFGERLSETYHGKVQIVGMSVSSNKQTVLKQRDDLKLTFPVLDGAGLLFTYSVEGTPSMVLLDEAGIVRLLHPGWGNGTPSEITDELRRCLK